MWSDVSIGHPLFGTAISLFSEMGMVDTMSTFLAVFGGAFGFMPSASVGSITTPEMPVPNPEVIENDNRLLDY